MDHAEYLQSDATALARKVCVGEVGAERLLDLALAQLARVQPHVNAVVRVMEAEARAQLAGPLRGPLAGVPFLLKDGLQDFAGIPTTDGSRAGLRAPAPACHAAITRRFLDAGLVVFGKTNLPELGLKGVSDSRLHGPVRNPWDLARNAGGSSGGAAAAVAAGVLPMAAGNDGGGSIRIPASCCGLFGLKPSRGRVSDGPGFGEVWFGACAQGVISRSVRDTALALDAICGAEPGDPFVAAAPLEPFVRAVARPPRRLRIGWTIASPIGAPVHPQAVAAVERALALLTALGHDVVRAAPAIDGEALARAYLHVYFGQVPVAIAQARARGARESEFEPLTRLTAALGRAVPGPVLTAELARWNAFARALAAFHAEHDLFLTPTVATLPPRHGELDLPAAQETLLLLLARSGVLGLLARSGLIEGVVQRIARDNMAPFPFTQLANLTGTPAMSVPLHWTPEGLPMGVHFVGRMGEEATLLQLAAQLETAAPWFDRLPQLARAEA